MEAEDWFEGLEALGRSQGFLTYAQVNDRLPLTMVDPEEIERTVERLKTAGIRVVPESPS
jgi:RNA polymerase primary sigma factor